MTEHGGGQDFANLSDVSMAVLGWTVATPNGYGGSGLGDLSDVNTPHAGMDCCYFGCEYGPGPGPPALAPLAPWTLGPWALPGGLGAEPPGCGAVQGRGIAARLVGEEV